jgi:hypothetical protein
MEMGYTPCKADPDVWLRPAKKPDGTGYYEYLLTYVDDCLVVSHNPQQIITSLEMNIVIRSPLATNRAFRVTSIFMSNIIISCTCLNPGNGVPSSFTSKAILTPFASFIMASYHSVLLFSISRAIASSIVLGTHMPNLYPFLTWRVLDSLISLFIFFK